MFVFYICNIYASYAPLTYVYMTLLYCFPSRMKSVNFTTLRKEYWAEDPLPPSGKRPENRMEKCSPLKSYPSPP